MRHESSPDRVLARTEQLLEKIPVLDTLDRAQDTLVGTMNFYISAVKTGNTTVIPVFKTHIKEASKTVVTIARRLS